MAKITFEFTRDFSKQNNETGQGMEGIGVNVSMTELSPENESGPQDILVHIIARMGSSIIEVASNELLAIMKESGAEAFCTRYQPKKH